MTVTKDTPNLSPMMQKYLETKEEYEDAILFYRLGDFYEMFLDDALTASRVLEITLTGKNCGLPERVPMCGVPFHSAASYINKLVENGYKVAICEQVEDPKLAKGLVKREVVRIVTPGTNIDPVSLKEDENNYLMSICFISGNIGISICDVSTGDYYLCEVEDISKLYDEINKYMPSEIVCNSMLKLSGIDIDDIKDRLGIVYNELPDKYFEKSNAESILLKHFKISSLIGLGIDEFTEGICASGALLRYLYDTQKISLDHITHLLPYSNGKYMILDFSTRRNLELTLTLREKQKKGSLFGVLDRTKTAMGARFLRSSIEQPLLKKEDIDLRLDSITSFNENIMERDEIREYLQGVYDLERLMAKVSYGSVNPRDMIALKNSLELIPHIKDDLNEFPAALLNDINSQIDGLEDIYNLLDNAFIMEPPLSSKEGGFVKEGYSSDIDYLRGIKQNSKELLSEIETEERENTGIKNLRIKFNKVFGYCIEVTNSFKEQVPAYYIRRQTLTNCERYTIPKLKELEDNILNAEDKLYSLEYDVFVDVRSFIMDRVDRIQHTAKALAYLDMLLSFAYVSEKNNYIKPSIEEDGIINIKGGRHPVVEKMIRDDSFINNDTFLNNDEHQISIITGPNMSGKSTYMRQTALIVLMAQIGCYVPANSAHIGLVDRIFTRVGASDDLASGQSTFMVEMNEVSNILKNATKDSLLILDEIGRGTSTFDGLSIAWAVVEYISKSVGAKTLFATHYHELTSISENMKNVKNYCVAVKESGDDVVFLRKIIEGPADKSYGIYVASLAGVPESVIARAREIANSLSSYDVAEKVLLDDEGIQSALLKSMVPIEDKNMTQMSIYSMINNDEIIDTLKSLNVDSLTPVEALNILNDLKKKLI